MDKILNDYLDKVDHALKPMAISDRVDVIKELKGHILDLENQNALTPEQIIEQLGSPRELAKSYLGGTIARSGSFNPANLRNVLAFYSLAGLGGLFILPITSVLSVGLIFCGVIAPVAGLIKFLGFLAGIDVPFIMFQLGPFVAHPALALVLSIGMGLLLFFGGKWFWKKTIQYIQFVSQGKQKLAN